MSRTRCEPFPTARRLSSIGRREPISLPTAREMKVLLEPDPIRKRELHERLTAMLPEWFGRPASNAKYARQAELLDGYVAESDGVRRGLLLLKWTSPASAEIYWIGVDPAVRGSGVGRALMEA